MIKRFCGLLLALALPLAAQTAASDPSENNPTDFDARLDATVVLQLSLHGTLNVSIYSYKLPFESIPATLNAIPHTEGHWIVSRRDDHTFAAVCRNCVLAAAGVSDNSSGRGALRLAPLVESLHVKHHLGEVWLAVSLPEGVPDPLPTGWTSADGPGSQNRELTFQSFDDDGLPPDLPVPLEAPLEAWSVLVPLGVVLIAPWVLAHFIRRRATHASAGQKVNWMVWMNWINLGAWLYWISVVHPADVAELLGGLASSSYLVAVAAGVAVWSLPPLIAVAACLVAMAPLLSSSLGSFLPLLKRHVVSQAAFLVPLGIFLVGSQVSSEEAGVESATVSMVAAYVAYRTLAWYAWTLSYAEVHPIESGELFERVRMLARTAGVTVSRLGLLRTRVPQEANAFAMPGGQIVLTESLVNGLTPREVDAVIAHELGHHKAGHLKVNWSKILFWVYLLGAGSFFGWLNARFHLPLWLMTLPILPLLFTVLQGLLSQRREFTADARAVEITGDPEGTIAALARLAQLSRVPTGDRGIVGSIMSHPSMEGRVLALARKNNVPDGRALEILRNPDSAYAGAPPPAATQPLPAEPPHTRAMVFTLRAKAALFEQLGWIRLLTPLAGAFLIAAGIAQFSDYPAVDGWRTLLLLAVAPILALQLAFEYFMGRRFERRMRRGIARKHSAPARSNVRGSASRLRTPLYRRFLRMGLRFPHARRRLALLSRGESAFRHLQPGDPEYRRRVRPARLVPATAGGDHACGGRLHDR